MRGFDSYLTFQKLEVFCTVAELGSVTRAADRLCIAQPVVTAHLRSLESRLGYSLVARSGRNIALTEAGERVYRWAAEVISRTREIERELAGMEKGSAGNAVIATSMSVGSYSLPPLISAFHRKHPDGLITVQISNPQAALDATRIGGCDFAVILLAPTQDLGGLMAIPLWEDDLLLVCAPSSQWTRGGPQDVDLQAVPFISTPKNLARRELEDMQLRKYGLETRHVVMELGHPEAAKHAVREDIGLSFMLACSVRDDIRRGDLVALEWPGMSMKIPTYLVHREDKRFSAYQSGLVQFLLESSGR
ncbi:LysR family transcriptional regulator [Bordetella pseudohinzii]|uniref:LysR family transcriptional regulator n=4 Tax=Bordetella pseudohinzii TaxID=1331258 RepID=A0ABN4RSL4_9BORD|nr:LysR family transcriptional regulator [Bordetella pseudohinzii]ANY16561.1 LysR family transcriptional regulator [Bordetella pseudohinzii]KMM27713.1 LysR family transcriptional regulator [Bordetella pseudohinzii]KXA81865.1 LysR family transcriptional regulator [Bordetella pseudohinzii]KXA82166.1 LysR family transcriptional regulator [Bordetella pseudohinzii]